MEWISDVNKLTESMDKIQLEILIYSSVDWFVEFFTVKPYTKWIPSNIISTQRERERQRLDSCAVNNTGKKPYLFLIFEWVFSCAALSLRRDS